MNVTISLEKAKEIAQSGKYDVIPVGCEILSDFITPIELVRKLKSVSRHCYMLESAQANEYWGRYTFVGYEPTLAISLKDGEMSFGDKTIKTTEPWKELREILSNYKSPMFDDLPRWTGGVFCL